jgi:hypothetical protein
MLGRNNLGRPGWQMRTEFVDAGKKNGRPLTDGNRMASRKTQRKVV